MNSSPRFFSWCLTAGLLAMSCAACGGANGAGPATPSTTPASSAATATSTPGGAATTSTASSSSEAGLVGSVTGGDLHTDPVTITVPLSTEPPPASSDSRHYYLNVGHITGKRPLASYTAYLNAPADALTGNTNEWFAGNLSGFGVEESKDQGLTVVLDVTAVIARLRETNRWTPTQLQVTFVPKRSDTTGANALHIGRIALYHCAAGGCTSS